MKRTLQKGFTVVEILVVIVVIAILVMVTATIYQSVQVQVRDAKNADGADKIADAMQLYIAKNGTYPNGGWGSTTAIGGGTNCADGVNGWFTTGTYTCTLEDTLIASKYLPAGFSTGLSPNSKYNASLTNGSLSIMVYRYGDKAMVMYSMEDPAASDTAHFNAELTKCTGSIPGPGAYAPRDTYKMANGTCIQFKTF